MKSISFACLALYFFSCADPGDRKAETTLTESFAQEEKIKINNFLDNWHKAAANADFDEYFAKFSDNGIFIGTDPTENWKNQEFREWSEPHFESGNAWDFTALDRNIYFSRDGNIAWFDELLDTQMGVCRGSGVLSNKNDSWNIEHYVLSIAIPNQNVPEVTDLKKEFDSRLISKLKSK